MRYNLSDLVEVRLTKYVLGWHGGRKMNQMHAHERKLNGMQDNVEEVVMNICKYRQHG
jgi:hypothetical protein